MQPWTHLLYLSVASGVPSPWSHFAAHSLVSTTWEELGRAMPKHWAWQVTSPAGQATAQLCWGVRLALAALAGAVVMVEASWGAAIAPAMREMMMVEYFMVTVDRFLL